MVFHIEFEVYMAHVWLLRMVEDDYFIIFVNIALQRLAKSG